MAHRPSPVRSIESSIESSAILKQSLGLALVFALLGLVYIAFAPTYQWRESRENVPFGADFLQEWIGGHMIESGEARRLYTERFIELQHSPAVVGFQWNESDFFPAVYPPPHYFLFSPFALLPYRTAVYVFLGLLLTAAWAASLMIARLARSVDFLPVDSDLVSPEQGLPRLLRRPFHSGPLNWGPLIWGPLIWGPVLLIFFPATFLSISLGQKSLIWLMIWSAIAYNMRMHHSFKAGLLLGALSIKPTLVFLMPLIMFKERNWRCLSGAFVSGTLIWGMAAISLPLDVWQGFWSQVQGIADYSSNSGYRPEWACNLLSLANLVPASWQSWFKVAVCLPIACAILYGLMTDKRSWERPERWFALLCSTALLAPHFYHYDLVLLILPLIWNMAIAPIRSGSFIAVLFVAFALSNSVGQATGVPIFPFVLLSLLTTYYGSFHEPPALVESRSQL